MITDDHVTIVDRLLALPFPAEHTRESPNQNTWEGYRSSGPAHHVYVLRASRDFWDDRGEEAVEAAEAEIDAAFQALGDALTVRWGAPETVGLWPYRKGEDPAPEPMSELCRLTGEMFVWRRADDGRWVALAVGQADPEFPIVLLAAVAEVPIPWAPLGAVQGT